MADVPIRRYLILYPAHTDRLGRNQLTRGKPSMSTRKAAPRYERLQAAPLYEAKPEREVSPDDPQAVMAADGTLRRTSARPARRIWRAVVDRKWDSLHQESYQTFRWELDDLNVDRGDWRKGLYIPVTRNTAGVPEVTGPDNIIRPRDPKPLPHALDKSVGYRVKQDRE